MSRSNVGALAVQLWIVVHIDFGGKTGASFYKAQYGDVVRAMVALAKFGSR